MPLEEFWWTPCLHGTANRKESLTEFEDSGVLRDPDEIAEILD